MMKTNGILIFMKIIEMLNFFNNSIVGVELLRNLLTLRVFGENFGVILDTNLMKN